MTVYSIFAYVGIAALLLSFLRFLFAKPQHYFINFLQHFVGALFIFSGFVKAVDPLGTSYKMHDYFEALHIEWMDPAATTFAVIMITLEIALGVAIIIGWRPKLTASLLLLMTLFFTFLTGFTYLSGYSPTPLFWVLLGLANAGFAMYGIVEKPSLKKVGLWAGILSLAAIFVTVKFTSLSFGAAFSETKMKVTDCGCFGDFIKLKPWETFWKDVFLDVLILILALNYQRISTLTSYLGRTVLAYGTLAISLVFCLYNFMWSEPVIDFRPYQIGSDINVMRTVVQPEKRDFVFIYKNKNTKEEKEFKTSELGDVTEDWEYVDRRDIILDPGIPAKITNLFIFNHEQEEVTEDLLHNPEYSLAVVSYKLSKSCDCCFKEELDPIAKKCKEVGIDFYGLTSEDAAPFVKRHDLSFPFYSSDETPLKTIMRSNPGLLLLKNGVVINKWHRKDFPTYDELNKQYFKK